MKVLRRGNGHDTGEGGVSLQFTIVSLRLQDHHPQAQGLKWLMMLLKPTTPDPTPPVFSRSRLQIQNAV